MKNYVSFSLTVTDVRFVLVFKVSGFCPPATGSSVLKGNTSHVIITKSILYFNVIKNTKYVFIVFGGAVFYVGKVL